MEGNITYKTINTENKSVTFMEPLLNVVPVVIEDIKEESVVIEEIIKEEKNEIIKEEVINKYIWCLHIDCLCELDYFSNIIELEKHMLEEH